MDRNMSDNNIDTPLVVTSGHFLYLHAGHTRLLEYCKSLGTTVVALNGSYWHSRKYGENAVPVQDRRYTLEACQYVDHVIVFDEQTPAELIIALQPDYFIKGPDYKNTVLPEQYACDLVGCRTVIYNGSKGRSDSTSGLLLFTE